MCIGPARACPTTQPGHDRARPAACADASDPVAAAALQLAVDAVPAEPSKDPLADLTAELADFQRGVSRPGRLSLVGTMLQDSTAPELRARYRDEVIAPRRRRIRAILRRAQQLGLIDPDADLQIAVTLGTGSWYARALATSTPPPHWPERTAALVWRAVGGTLPQPSDPTPETAHEINVAPTSASRVKRRRSSQQAVLTSAPRRPAWLSGLRSTSCDEMTAD
jgi:hypothetical protein